MGNSEINKILIFGAGYVGFSIGVFLGQKYEVTVAEIDDKKITMINNFQSPIDDVLIDYYLKNKEINIKATDNIKASLEDTDLCILALPTNFQDETKQFDVRILSEVINKINSIRDDIPIIIK